MSRIVRLASRDGDVAKESFDAAFSVEVTMVAGVPIVGVGTAWSPPFRRMAACERDAKPIEGGSARKTE